MSRPLVVLGIVLLFAGAFFFWPENETEVTANTPSISETSPTDLSIKEDRSTEKEEMIRDQKDRTKDSQIPQASGETEPPTVSSDGRTRELFEKFQSTLRQSDLPDHILKEDVLRYFSGSTDSTDMEFFNENLGRFDGTLKQPCLNGHDYACVVDAQFFFADEGDITRGEAEQIKERLKDLCAGGEHFDSCWAYTHALTFSGQRDEAKNLLKKTCFEKKQAIGCVQLAKVSAEEGDQETEQEAHYQGCLNNWIGSCIRYFAHPRRDSAKAYEIFNTHKTLCDSQQDTKSCKIIKFYQD